MAPSQNRSGLAALDIVDERPQRGWHQAPAKEGRDVSRLHLQVMSVLRAPGKLKYLAGSESGVGGWVNDVPPERIAARLRQAVA